MLEEVVHGQDARGAYERAIEAFGRNGFLVLVGDRQIEKLDQQLELGSATEVISVNDSYPPAVRELPQWGLRAEYWIEGVGGREDDDLTDSGAYTRVVTDQVRFYPIDAPGNRAHAGGGAYRQGSRWQDGTSVDLLPLTGIPELVLSEVLRDVDLFVGVASVGNDPTWQDGGPGGRFREYWTSYGFGELSQTAATRRELLTRLVPRLAIADRCTVGGRFLPGPRRSEHVPDPSRLGQHPGRSARALSVHRPVRGQRRGERRIPALRG
ncbi:hypothetical protein AB0D12_09265 [Streptomyces sp. NPDC048479]|uniref:hypothetical protein n=1 Tax=Streptomyces sp. NPDC048479 TaxID=3154725 RepID=UPI00343C8BB6